MRKRFSKNFLLFSILFTLAISCKQNSSDNTLLALIGLVKDPNSVNADSGGTVSTPNSMEATLCRNTATIDHEPLMNANFR
jgi:hypothetical protein